MALDLGIAQHQLGHGFHCCRVEGPENWTEATRSSDTSQQGGRKTDVDFPAQRDLGLFLFLVICVEYYPISSIQKLFETTPLALVNLRIESLDLSDTVAPQIAQVVNRPLNLSVAFSASGTFLWIESRLSALPRQIQIHESLQVHELTLVILHIREWPAPSRVQREFV